MRTEARVRGVAVGVGVAVGSLAAATVGIAVLQDGLGVPNPSALYVVAVVATALVSGTTGAVVVSIASFLLYNYLFTEPRGTLAVDDPAVWLSVILLLFVGVVVGQLTSLQRARAATARAREREAVALFQLSRALATRPSTLDVLPDIAAILAGQGHMRRVWITLGADDATERLVADTAAPGTSPPVPNLVRVLQRRPGDEPAQWIRVRQPTVGGHARTDVAVFRVRIESGGASMGSVWAARDMAGGDPDRTDTRLLAAAADQVGQALAHDRLAAESAAAEIARQGDALKSALLQSVSHDLRTPLATIRAAAGSLRPDAGLTAEEQRENVDAIDREVEYLNRLVTNLLDLGRIEGGALRAERDVFELDDLVGRTLDRIAPRLAGRPLELALDAPPVRVDPIFLDEAITNVLENALKYTPATAPIRLRADARPDDMVRLTIEDGGVGVPEAALHRLFEKFYRVPGRPVASRAGTGIGLAVVRGLVEAMGGRVGARRSELGGLAIDVDLPAAGVPMSVATPGTP